jgi:hypothetical protein
LLEPSPPRAGILAQRLAAWTEPQPAWPVDELSRISWQRQQLLPGRSRLEGRRRRQRTAGDGAPYVEINEALRAPCWSSFGKFLNVALPDRLGTLTDCDGVYSESCSPDPPNSFGKSFSFGRPSCMGKGQGRTSAMAAWLRRHLSARSSDGGSSGGHRSCCSSVAGSMASSEIR